MPPGLALNLFVTTTDINGYNRQIPIADPPADQHCRQQARLRVPPPRRRRQPRQHAQPGARVRRARDLVLPRRVPRDGARRHPAPGVARAASPTEFCRVYELADSPVDHDVLRRRRRARQLPVQACGARDRRQARRPRRSTGGSSSSSLIPARPAQAPTGTTPGFRSTIWAGLSKLPRRQPIGDALDELMQYNRRVLRRQADDQRGRGRRHRLGRAAARARLRRREPAANTGAIGSSGFSFQAYLALKLLSVVGGHRHRPSRAS